MRKLLGQCILILLSTTCWCQNNSVFNCHSYMPYDRFLYNSENRFHTSVKPYDVNEVNTIVNIDTLYVKHCKNKVLNYALNNNIIQYKSKDFNFTINPTFNFELSNHNGENNDKTGWINDRGVFINGNITDKVYFYTAFHEIQSDYSDYRRNIISEFGTVPGMCNPRKLGEGTILDYAYAEGYASFIPNKHLAFQLGHGKNFIGDGYRSLMLSDNTQNHPYCKITSNFGPIKYTLLWAQQHYTQPNHKIFVRYSIKWNTVHYFDWVVCPQFAIGFFQAIMTGSDSTNTGNFNLHYLNPLPFVVPQENAEGAKDNCIVGLNEKLTLWENHVLYSQIVLNTNNCKGKELFKENGYWANRYAFQIGYKTFDIAKIKNLDFQTEFNYIRPFMYAHETRSETYNHARQPLAHPRGANLYESVSFLHYNWKRIFFQMKYEYLVYGKDTTNSNMGGNIAKTVVTRGQDYNNATTQSGNRNTITYSDFTVSYLLNPKSAMNVTFGISHRRQSSELEVSKNQWLYYIGFRTNLGNFYYDF